MNLKKNLVRFQNFDAVWNSISFFIFFFFFSKKRRTIFIEHSREDDTPMQIKGAQHVSMKLKHSAKRKGILSTRDQTAGGR